MMLRVRWARVLLLIALGACARDVPVEWHDEADHRWRALSVPSRGDAGFSAMSARRTRIDFENRLSRATAMDHDHLLVGSGVAVGDYDGDGRPDLYFPRLEGPNALYRNQGDWRFEDVTTLAGVEAEGRHSTGAAFADVDGDGDLDLFVTALGGPNALFRNDGSGGFTDVTVGAGLASDLGSTSSSFADIDGDGDLDLYVANYKVESAADVLRPYEKSDITLIVERDGVRSIAEEFEDHFRLEIRDGVEIAVEQADVDRLYLNEGDGTFSPVSWTDGAFLDADGAPLERELDDFGLAVRFYDVDQDGDPDLYVCNDFDDPDYFWLNDGSGTFQLVDRFALRSQSHASMAVDFSDVNRDGRIDFFVADMLSSLPERRLAQVPLHAALEKPAGRVADRPQVARNSLFLARGDGTWAQIAEMAGVDGSEWTWGSLFLDVDLDGFEDLLVANGHGRDMRDGDALQRVTGLRGSVTWNEAKSLYPDMPTLNRAFRNRGDLTFEEVGAEWGFADEADVAHGMATGDLDGDGDLDVVLNRLNKPPSLMRNDVTAPRVAVRLVGEAPNTQGIGARIRLYGGGGGDGPDVPFQDKEVTAGGLYLSGSQTLVSFAAGADTLARSLVVTWRDGSESRLQVRPNRLYEIDESAAEPGSPEPDRRAAELVFEDVSHLIDHGHVDVPFGAFARQPLLPYDLSRLGPGVTWADLDRDGDPDLVVGGGQGDRTGVLRNDGDRFTPLTGPVAQHDQTTVLPTWVDGAVSLLVGQSSFDAGTSEEARALPAVVSAAWNAGSTAVVVAGPNVSSVGPLAQADVDGDGDLDLFVGGRTVPAFYPLPASSRLLVNQDGSYTEDERAAALFADIGLVSGALFSDVDGDADPDLVLALEWGSLRLFLNQGGRFTDATETWGLAAMTGLWRGVAAGDLNGDGRMDLVATNEGTNTRLQSSIERPLTLVHSDVDQSGTWEVLQSRPRAAGGPLFPLTRFEQARGAIPALRSRISSFGVYAQATVAEVLGVAPSDIFQLPARTLEHTVFLNVGDRFEATPLPTEAQLAPAHDVGIADVDGDGLEDVVITQNFFPTEGFTPRYDAGRGLVLLGDGVGGLTAVDGSRSGLIVYGDQRGAAFADFDGDARIDVAVAQNGAGTKLFRNVGARPGLRVVLVGSGANPTGVGARIRVRYARGYGPVREIASGSGYWSSDDAVHVLGLREAAEAVEVRWPDGTVTETPVPEGAREVEVRIPVS